MGDKSAIEWTDATWNPLRARDHETGAEGWACVRVSPGCVNCYAATLNETQRWGRGTGRDYVVGALERVETYLHDETLTQPLRWRKPRMIFVCSMTDLFGEWVPDEAIDRVFAVMALSPQHKYQVLTKRPERMLAYIASKDRDEEAPDGSTRRDDGSRVPTLYDYLAAARRGQSEALTLWDGLEPPPAREPAVEPTPKPKKAPAPRQESML